MAQGFIYMVDAKGGLKRMMPSAPETEDHMQALIARYPELITDGDGDLLLIRREQCISDRDNRSGRWSVDHLFVTRDAVPVLVELKRAVDTRLRREVVGQMLDYAANATAYWQAGQIADSFARTTLATGKDPGESLQAFIGEQAPEIFWQQVDANFSAGRIKLVFVADEIPRELARIVEFLNEQMRAEVRAVELRWYTGEDGTITLSPRLIGETERAAATKRTQTHLEPITRDQWLQTHIAPFGAQTLDGALAFISLVEQLGGDVGISSRQGSLYASLSDESGTTFSPVHLWASGAQVSFSLRNLHQLAAFTDEATRRRLYDDLTAIVGQLSSTNLQGYPAFPVSQLANDEVAGMFKQWLAQLAVTGMTFSVLS
ncbi:hypothetical protein [Asticcacaulis tiandongensis]|uniref:hypothetical protein n=1 Tax=Asticcacaulis tiandongensis TaxID=2565365 RepID=UPI00112EF8AD|nr:hypothetical protein [Asticcacaulis tiandongensis]